MSNESTIPREVKQNLQSAKDFCDTFEKYYDTKQRIYDVCSALLYDKNLNQRTQIIEYFNQAFASLRKENVAEKETYENKRIRRHFQALISSNEYETDSVLGLFEEMLCNTELQKLKFSWKKDICVKFAETVLPYFDKDGRLLEMLKHFVFASEWTEYDVYLLLKALIFMFSSECDQFLELLLILRCNKLTPDSIRYTDDKQEITISYILRCGLKENFSLIKLISHDLDNVIEKLRKDYSWNFIGTDRIEAILESVSSMKDDELHIEFNKKFSLLHKHPHDLYDENEFEKYFLAIILAVKLSSKYFPRVTQCISYQILLIQSQSTGYLLEVKSGEGKSCILAMTAATYALIGKQVDIVTSSPVLAQRDCDDWANFYKLLNVTVCCNEIADAQSYKCDVVYGTIGNFSRDILRTKFLFEDIRLDRQCDLVLVDEVDSMLIDQSIQCTYLSHDVASSGLKHLEPVLTTIWMHVTSFITLCYKNNVAKVLYRGPLQAFCKTLYDCFPNSEKFYEPLDFLQFAEDKDFYDKYVKCMDLNESTLMLEAFTIDNMITIIHKIKYLLDDFNIQLFRLTDNEELVFIEEIYNDTKSQAERDKIKTIRILLCNKGLTALLYTLSSLTVDVEQMILPQVPKQEEISSENQFDIPEFLRRYTLNRLPFWVKNAFKAKQMHLNREYMVYNNRFIYPIDYASTGVVEVNKKWGDGLQQFLEIKHELPLSPIPFMTNFLSNMAFIKLYKKVLGVSGTLGSDADKEFMEKNYAVKFVTIPTFHQKLFYELDGLLLDGEDEWVSAIYRQVDYWYNVCNKSTGAVLILCEDISTAEKLKKSLQGMGNLMDNLKLKLYCRSDKKSDQISITQHIESGVVFISTNLGSRGTDYHISREVAVSGGLFVIVTFLPYNERVEDQAFGRTARQGAPGAAQLIVDKQKLPIVLKNCQNIHHAKSLRKQNNVYRMNFIEKNEIKTLQMRDELFNIYCKLLSANYDQLEKLNFQKDLTKAKMNILNEIWAEWMEVKSTNLKEEDFDALKKDLVHVINTAGKLLSEGGVPKNNFYYLLNCASSLMLSAHYDEAITMYGTVIKEFDMWSSFAHFNRAYCILQLHSDETYLHHALEDLRNAKIKLTSYKTELLCTQLSVILSRREKIFFSSFSNHMQARFKILECIEKNIDDVIKMLQENRNQKVNVAVSNITSQTLFNVCNDDEELSEILQELQQLGLVYVFNISQSSQIHGGNCIAYYSTVAKLFAEIGFTGFYLGKLVNKSQLIDPFDDQLILRVVSGDFNIRSWNFVKAFQLCLSQTVARCNANLEVQQNPTGSLQTFVDYINENELAKSITTFQPYFEDKSIQLVFNYVLKTARRSVAIHLRKALSAGILYTTFLDFYNICALQRKDGDWLTIINKVARDILTSNSINLQRTLASLSDYENVIKLESLFTEDSEFMFLLGDYEFCFRVARDVHRLQLLLSSGNFQDKETPLCTCSEVIVNNIKIIVEKFNEQLAEEIANVYNMQLSQEVSDRLRYKITDEIIRETENNLIELFMWDIKYILHSIVSLMNNATIFAYEFTDNLLLTKLKVRGQKPVHINRNISMLSSGEESKISNMIKKHHLSLVLRHGLESALPDINLQNIVQISENKIELPATFIESKSDLCLEDIVTDASFTPFHSTLFTVVNCEDIKLHSSNTESLFQKFSSCKQASIIVIKET